MLNELQISQLGVIEHTSAEFPEGLSVVTGETGAGKTMVVSSLRLLSGHRADASKVRHGADRASVEGIFTTSAQTDAPVRSLVEEAGGTVEETPQESAHEVIASRTVLATGRSRAHLGGKTVPAAVLGNFASTMITIHGQNDQLRLIDASRQLTALDEFAGLTDSAAEFRTERRRWRKLVKDLQHRLDSRRELALETETLQRAIEEIDGIDPQPGEDDQLKADIRGLQQADDLRDMIVGVLNALDGPGAGGGVMDDLGEQAGAVDQVAQAQQGVDSILALTGEQLTGEGTDYRELSSRLAEVSLQLSDIAGELNQVLLNVPDPDALDSMLERQRELKTLRKYAVDVDGAIAWRDQAQQRLASIDVSDDEIARLRSQVEDAEQRVLELGTSLSSQRRTAAKAFGDIVSEEIRGLHMTAAIRVAITSATTAAESNDQGLDTVEFRLVQGGQEQPLASSASGGELSRVMLALEVILAGSGRTLVFDEVDAGVGGKAAVEIGHRLAALAVDNQVIVVTHLPQVAAFADAHLYVAKQASDESVSSSVRQLDRAERVEELSRMLAGLESDTGRAHAEELLDMAQRAKADATPRRAYTS